MKTVETQTTEITIRYDDKSPLQGSCLMIDSEFQLEPLDFEPISDDGKELIIEIQTTTQPCRFLGLSDGSPAACFGFGNPAMNGQPWWMEDRQYTNDPAIICLHCRLYAGEWEPRKYPRTAETISHHGIAELLPELSRKEIGAYADSINHVDARTGKVLP